MFLGRHRTQLYHKEVLGRWAQDRCARGRQALLPGGRDAAVEVDDLAAGLSRGVAGMDRKARGGARAFRHIDRDFRKPVAARRGAGGELLCNMHGLACSDRNSRYCGLPQIADEGGLRLRLRRRGQRREPRESDQQRSPKTQRPRRAGRRARGRAAQGTGPPRQSVLERPRASPVDPAAPSDPTVRCHDPHPSITAPEERGDNPAAPAIPMRYFIGYGRVKTTHKCDAFIHQF